MKWKTEQENQWIKGQYMERKNSKPGDMRTITDQFKLSGVALQELPWPGFGSIKSEIYTILYSGSDNGRHIDRVGFMVSDALLPRLKCFTSVINGLWILKLEGNFWDIVVINCFATVEEGSNDIKCDFYAELEKIYDTQPKTA